MKVIFVTAQIGQLHVPQCKTQVWMSWHWVLWRLS